MDVLYIQNVMKLMIVERARQQQNDYSICVVGGHLIFIPEKLIMFFSSLPAR